MHLSHISPPRNFIILSAHEEVGQIHQTIDDSIRDPGNSYSPGITTEDPEKGPANTGPTPGPGRGASRPIPFRIRSRLSRASPAGGSIPFMFRNAQHARRREWEKAAKRRTGCGASARGAQNSPRYLAPTIFARRRRQRQPMLCESYDSVGGRQMHPTRNTWYTALSHCLAAAPSARSLARCSEAALLRSFRLCSLLLGFFFVFLF